MTENIEKLAPPKSVPIAMRQDRVAALGSYNQAHGTRSRGCRIALAYYERIRGTQSGDISTVHVPGDADAMIRRASILMAQARDKINTVGKKLGVQ